VRIPLSGAVAIGGLDEKTAAGKLANALRPYVMYPAVSIETTIQGTNLFVAGGPVGVLKYQPGETLATAIADEMQPSASTSDALNAAGQSLTKGTDTNATLRSRIDLHAVKVERDHAAVGIYDVVALGAQGQTGPLLEPGDRIIFRYKPVEVRVLGDVSQPGPTYLSSDQSMSEAIAQAGGLLPTSSSNHVLVQRDGQTHSLALGDPMFIAPAQNGDIVTVPAAPRINVVGTVVAPGVVSLRTDSTLLSAVYTAGGPAKFADLRGVQVVRGETKTSYDITALTHGDVSQNPVLQDGDTVLVPRNRAIDFTPFFGILGGIAAGFTNHLPL
jgi:protein involved in polysaccharide export with SLBB domain